MFHIIGVNLCSFYDLGIAIIMVSNATLLKRQVHPWTLDIHSIPFKTSLWLNIWKLTTIKCVVGIIFLGIMENVGMQ